VILRNLPSGSAQVYDRLLKHQAVLDGSCRDIVRITPAV
jgi:hypothetical protein